MSKQRLDQVLAQRGLVTSRSQAESWIKLGKVTVDGTVVTKPGFFVREDVEVELKAEEQYVSRAGLKLASVAALLKLSFKDKTVLDVGSSTGGFTDYALRHGAKKVFAVDVGTEQLHPSLRGNERIELYEKMDIRDVVLASTAARISQVPVSVRESRGEPRESRTAQPERVRTGETVQLAEAPDIVVIDVSFISLREILPHVATLSDANTQIVAMVKPQFEAGKHQVSKGVIKNDAVRRDILKDFEMWAKQYFVIQDKRDSDVAGSKGNKERFYLLKVSGK